MNNITENGIKSLMEDEKKKAWQSLSCYKFWMFGYHAAAWVKFNKLLPNPLPNPFKNLVNIARGENRCRI